LYSGKVSKVSGVSKNLYTITRTTFLLGIVKIIEGLKGFYSFKKKDNRVELGGRK